MRDPTPLPTLDRLGISSFSADSLDAHKIGSEWFDSFSSAMQKGDVKGIVNLFIDGSSWRDTLALTWSIRTFQELSRVSTFLNDVLPRHSADLSNFVLKEGPALSRPFEDLAWIQAAFEFETKVAKCSGRFTLVPQPSQEWKAYLMYTNLEELKGHPEHLGHLRNPHSNHGKWVSARQAEVEFKDQEPTVVICGAGQSGLDLAARLKVLGVKSLVVEKNERVGDNWRGRYEALCLHDPVWYDHMPYMPFPSTWPVYTPAAKLANWLEHYAESLELNIWTSSTITSAHKDANGEWLVTVAKANGEERVLKPRYFVFATGLGAGTPNMPVYPGMDRFKGQMLHSMQHKKATDHAGKKVVVIGACTAAHDICVDYADHGIDVTMYQRSSTHVVSTKNGFKRLFAGTYEEGGPPTDTVDRIAAAYPNVMSVELRRRVTAKIAEDDRETLEGLKRIGFRTNLGPFDAGIILLVSDKVSGYYLDVGGSQYLIDGKIKLKSDALLKEFTETGLRFEDGSKIDTDVVVFATGIGDARGFVRKIIGDELAKSFTGVWGLDDEGEIIGAWKDCGVERMWYMLGNLALCRFHSKHIALQIKAMEEGIFGERYSK